jgi:hypothetical protein
VIACSPSSDLMSAIAADASRTIGGTVSSSGIVGGTRVISITFQSDRRDGVWGIRNPILDAPADYLETIDGRDRSSATRLDVIIETVAVLDGHEHRERSMVALDDEALAGRGPIEECAERFAKVQRGDDSHG